mmetsp:Transcript_8085/g.18773  ORF Transcript_8085/g.18773 Transcript_8085/m.18773 type:complete len:303 (+) Transcript_8085:206-1114(+)
MAQACGSHSDSLPPSRKSPTTRMASMALTRCLNLPFCSRAPLSRERTLCCCLPAELPCALAPTTVAAASPRHGLLGTNRQAVVGAGSGEPKELRARFGRLLGVPLSSADTLSWSPYTLSSSRALGQADGDNTVACWESKSETSEPAKAWSDWGSSQAPPPLRVAVRGRGRGVMGRSDDITTRAGSSAATADTLQVSSSLDSMPAVAEAKPQCVADDGRDLLARVLAVTGRDLDPVFSASDIPVRGRPAGDKEAGGMAPPQCRTWLCEVCGRGSGDESEGVRPCEVRGRLLGDEGEPVCPCEV